MSDISQLTLNGTTYNIKDTKVKQTANIGNAAYKLLFTTTASPTSGNTYETYYNSNLTYNPSTQYLYMPEGTFKIGGTGVYYTYLQEGGIYVYSEDEQAVVSQIDQQQIKTDSVTTSSLSTTKINGVTVGSSPKFTDTTYTFSGGTNSFTVTPSGGSAQTVNITPEISTSDLEDGAITPDKIQHGYSDDSRVLGKDFEDGGVTYPATAGMQAFCWSAVSNTGLDYTFTLSDGTSSTTPQIAVPVGALVSVKANYSASFCGKLKTALTTSSTQAVVTLFQSLPSNWVPSSYINDEEDGYLWFPEYPEAGVVIKGDGAFAFGLGSRANEQATTAFGRKNIADGRYSAAVGRENKVGYGGFSSGSYNEVYGIHNFASGDHNEVQSSNNLVGGAYNKVTGARNIVSGRNVEVTSYGNIVSGSFSSEPGAWDSTKTYGEGQQVTYNGYKWFSLHANNTEQPYGSLDTDYTHYEHWVPIGYVSGNGNISTGISSVTGNNAAAFGLGNYMSRNQGVVSGLGNVVTGVGANALGSRLIANNERELVIGKFNAPTSNLLAVAGWGTSITARKNLASLDTSGNIRVKGDIYTSAGDDSTGGNKLLTESSASSTYMTKVNPTGTGAFSLSRKASTAVGINSVAIGLDATASGNYSFAEGEYTTASGESSHAEGLRTYATGKGSHAENYGNATGEGSHAENYGDATGKYSHAEGLGTEASSECQHVQGKYNVRDSSGLYADIVGWGRMYEEGGFIKTELKNISALGIDGTLHLKGDVYVGCSNNSTGGTKLLTTVNTSDIVNSAVTSQKISGGAITNDKIALTIVDLGASNTITGDNLLTASRRVAVSGKYNIAIGGTTGSITNWTGIGDGQAPGPSGANAASLWKYNDNIFMSIAGGNTTTPPNTVSGTYSDYTDWIPALFVSSSVGGLLVGSGAVAGSNALSVGQGCFVKAGQSAAIGARNVVTSNNSIAVGVGLVAQQAAQSVFGSYNAVTNDKLVIGGGSASSRANLMALSSSGDLKIKGDVYIGCGSDGTGGTKLTGGNIYVHYVHIEESDYDIFSSLNIISSDNTVFTFQTCAAWLYSHGYTMSNNGFGIWGRWDDPNGEYESYGWIWSSDGTTISRIDSQTGTVRQITTSNLTYFADTVHQL